MVYRASEGARPSPAGVSTLALRVDIPPKMLRWAVDRSGLPRESIERKFPKYREWLAAETKPTLKQVDSFAKATYTPVGFLMLSEPPVEEVPIPDLRTIGNAGVVRPSANLLDTIYLCQQRQDWYRDFARAHGIDPIAEVGSATLRSSVVDTADSMRHALHLDLEERSNFSTWTEALRAFIETADQLGVLVMVSGVVGSNNRRRLDPEEFRGFALSDPLAPVVFINGSDSKSAQMFTLAHELAHLWLGESALSDVGLRSFPSERIEKWCNEVAAELLVPQRAIHSNFDETAALNDEVGRLARRFKVSTLVILRRLFDAGHLGRSDYWKAYDDELARLRTIKSSSGGNFYLTQSARAGKRFARSLIVSTLEGQTLHRDAFRLLGFSKVRTFHELGRNLGVMSWRTYWTPTSSSRRRTFTTGSISVRRFGTGLLRRMRPATSLASRKLVMRSMQEAMSFLPGQQSGEMAFLSNPTHRSSPHSPQRAHGRLRRATVRQPLIRSCSSRTTTSLPMLLPRDTP